MKLLSLILTTVSAVFILALAWMTVRRARVLSERIERHRAEQEAERSGNASANPYADLSGFLELGPDDEAQEEK